MEKSEELAMVLLGEGLVGKSYGGAVRATQNSMIEYANAKIEELAAFAEQPQAGMIGAGTIRMFKEKLK